MYVWAPKVTAIWYPGFLLSTSVFLPTKGRPGSYIEVLCKSSLCSNLQVMYAYLVFQMSPFGNADSLGNDVLLKFDHLFFLVRFFQWPQMCPSWAREINKKALVAAFGSSVRQDWHTALGKNKSSTMGQNLFFQWEGGGRVSHGHHYWTPCVLPWHLGPAVGPLPDSSLGRVRSYPGTLAIFWRDGVCEKCNWHTTFCCKWFAFLSKTSQAESTYCVSALSTVSEVLTSTRVITIQK